MLNTYSVSGVMCYHKYNANARTWRYIPVKFWRRMTPAERNVYRDHSVIQTQAVLSGRFGYSK